MARQTIQIDQSRLNKSCDYLLPAETPRLLPMPNWADLTPSNLRHTLEAQVSSACRRWNTLTSCCRLIFQTVHTWLPIVSKTRYDIQLSYAPVQDTPSGFSLLTLCMALVCKEPVGGDISPSTRSLYALLKSFVALLEVTGTNSLEILQGRLLLTIFEIGHTTMYPSAYTSSAANVRAAVSLGIGASYEDLCMVFPEPQEAEARRTWCAIVITDRLDMAPDMHQMALVLNQESAVDTSVWKVAKHPIFPEDDL